MLARAKTAFSQNRLNATLKGRACLFKMSSSVPIIMDSYRTMQAITLARQMIKKQGSRAKRKGTRARLRS